MIRKLNMYAFAISLALDFNPKNNNNNIINKNNSTNKKENIINNRINSSSNSQEMKELSAAVGIVVVIVILVVVCLAALRNVFRDLEKRDLPIHERDQGSILFFRNYRRKSYTPFQSRRDLYYQWMLNVI